MNHDHEHETSLYGQETTKCMLSAHLLATHKKHKHLLAAHLRLELLKLI